MIDRKLISIFQWIVDVTERQPAWLVEQTAWAFVTADIVATVLTWHGFLSFIGATLTLAVGTYMIISSRIPALLAKNAETDGNFRLWTVAYTIYNFFDLCFHAKIGVAAHLLSSVLLMACYYFAACKPPRPRRRRQTFLQRGMA
jgi:hypothetical protein